MIGHMQTVVDQSLERKPLELKHMSMSIDSQAQKSPDEEEQPKILHLNQGGGQVLNKDLYEVSGY